MVDLSPVLVVFVSQHVCGLRGGEEGVVRATPPGETTESSKLSFCSQD